MEKNIIKNVFEQVVAIDDQAETIIDEANQKEVQRDVRIRKKYRELELKIMKDVRLKVKDEFNQKMAETKKCEEVIQQKTADRIERIRNFYSAEKERLATDLFDDIFREGV